MDDTLLASYEKIFSLESLITLDSKHLNFFLNGFIGNFNNYIETCEDEKEVYYSAMNISGLDIPSPIKYKLVSGIMKSPRMRDIIWRQSLVEMKESLGETIGITDPELLEDLRDDLLGPDFQTSGYRAARDWTGFMEKIEPFVEQKINAVEDPEKIIFWSGRNTQELNEQYTTIENATIGDKMLFLESLVFINWASENKELPTFSPFWEELSDMYTKVVLRRLEKEEVTSIPFYSMLDDKDEVKFGSIFQNIELPIILDSPIERININVNNGEQYPLNIGPLKEQYQALKTTYEPKTLIPIINKELKRETQQLLGGEKAHG